MDCQDRYLVLYGLLASGRATASPRTYLFELAEAAPHCIWITSMNRRAGEFAGVETMDRIKTRTGLGQLDEIRAASAVTHYQEQHRATLWCEMRTDTKVRAVWRKLVN